MGAFQKNIFFSAIFVIATIFSKTSFSAPANKMNMLKWSELNSLTRTQQITYIKQIQEFFVKANKSEDAALYTSLWDALFPQSFAAYPAGQECIFAAKVNVLVESNKTKGRYFCPNPGRGDSCKEGDTECGLAFGKVCVTIPAGRSSDATKICKDNKLSDDAILALIKKNPAEWEKYSTGVGAYCDGKTALNFNKTNCADLNVQNKALRNLVSGNGSSTADASADGINMPVHAQDAVNDSVDKLNKVNAESASRCLVTRGETISDVVLANKNVFHLAQNSLFISDGVQSKIADALKKDSTQIQSVLTGYEKLSTAQSATVEKVKDLLGKPGAISWLAIDRMGGGTDAKPTAEVARTKYTALQGMLKVKGITDSEVLGKIFRLQYGEVYYLLATKPDLFSKKIDLQYIKKLGNEKVLSELEAEKSQANVKINNSLKELRAALALRKKPSNSSADDKSIDKEIDNTIDRIRSRIYGPLARANKDGRVLTADEIDRVLKQIEGDKIDEKVVRDLYRMNGNILNEGRLATNSLFGTLAENSQKGSGLVLSNVSDKSSLVNRFQESCNIDKVNSDTKKRETRANPGDASP